MEELKKVTLDPVQLSIEPQTKFLVLKQGKNEVKITRDHVINMKKLREGKIEANAFCSTLTPRNRFTVAENGNITIVCKDDYEDNIVILTNKFQDFKRIEDFVDKNRARIAWEREFKGRY
jgi:hypothetical protein